MSVLGSPSGLTATAIAYPLSSNLSTDSKLNELEASFYSVDLNTRNAFADDSVEMSGNFFSQVGYNLF